MSWEKIKFGDLFAEPTKNGIYKSSDAHGKGCKIVNMGELFAYDFIGNQEMKRIDMSEEELQKYGLKVNDLLFARRSIVESGAGKASIVVELNETATFESSIIRVRLDERKCFPLYYLYWLRSHAGKTAIGALVTGTNVKGIRGSELKNIEVDYPGYDIQVRIAGILKHYDDLIENNRKQIKLLEESAQRLYKEWFVDLRFPGHEHTKIVDGVPEGWEDNCLAKIAEFKRGKTITKAQIEPGTVPVVAGGLQPAYYHNIANTKAPVITVSASGANAGFTRMYYTDVFASDCSFVDRNTCSALPFVYCFLLNRKSELDSLQKGSAQPHVYAKDINALNLCVPNSDLINKFCEFSEQLFLKIGLLEQQNKNLVQTRDRLLPKLMSGEVEV